MSVATHINSTSVSYYGKNNKICAKILDNICQLLRSAEFVAAHRVNSCDFTRKRCLSPDVLVAFLLQMVGGRSLQVGLDQFFCALGGGTALLRVVTKSALSQARKKLKPSALAELGARWVREWLAAAGEARWHGWRVLAVDGSCVRVPRWRETQDSYGLGPNGDGSVVMARVVGLLGVASGQLLHAEIGAYVTAIGVIAASFASFPLARQMLKKPSLTHRGVTCAKSTTSQLQGETLTRHN